MAQAMGVLVIGLVIAGGAAFLWFNRCEPWLINMGIPLCNVKGGDKINDDADESGVGIFKPLGGAGKTGVVGNEIVDYCKKHPNALTCKRPKVLSKPSWGKGGNILSDKPMTFKQSKVTTRSIPSSKFNILKSNLATESLSRMSYS